MEATIKSQVKEISNLDALWTLIQGQTKAVRKALATRLIAEQNLSRSKKEKQKAMVKDSLAHAFDELHSGNVHHNARDLFKE